MRCRQFSNAMLYPSRSPTKKALLARMTSMQLEGLRSALIRCRIPAEQRQRVQHELRRLGLEDRDAVMNAVPKFMLSDAPSHKASSFTAGKSPYLRPDVGGHLTFTEVSNDQ